MSDVPKITVGIGTLGTIVLYSVNDVEVARTKGLISEDRAKELRAIFKISEQAKAYEQGIGTTVEKTQQGTDDDEKAKASANAQNKEIQRQEAIKNLAKARQSLAQADLNLSKAPEDKKAEAQQLRDQAEAKFKLAEQKYKEFEKEETPKRVYSASEQVKQKDKIDFGGQTVHIVDGEDNHIEVTQNAPTQRKNLKHTKDDEKERMARYYDERTGELITNKEELKSKRAQLKAEKKEAKKVAKALRKERKEAAQELRSAAKKAKTGSAEAQEKLKNAEVRLTGAVEDMAKARAERADATQEYSQVKQAEKASRGKGIGGDKRAYNKNAKRYDKIADLTTIYLYEGEEKAAIKANPKLKGHTETASAKDFEVLVDLYKMAETQRSKATTPQEQKAADAIWNNFKDIFPKKEDGSPDFTKVNPRKVQAAMMDLTGGGGKLDFTEVDMLSKELDLSKSQINHAFKTFGLETSNAFGKRLVNGLKIAAPVTALSFLEYYLTKNTVTEPAHADGHADAHGEGHAYDSQYSIDKAIAEAKATATANVPGSRYTWIDEDGIEHNKIIPGASETVTVTDRQEAVAEAYASAEAHAYADAAVDLSVDAAATAIAKLSPAALWAAPALAFIGGFAKKPVESSAAISGATTEKMARYVDVFKKNKNKNIGNQIIQYAEGRLTGNKALDEALVVAVLNNDIGVQNTVPTTRELRSALAHLDQLKEAIDAMKKEPPAPTQKPTETPVKPPTEAPTEPPTEAPTETPCITKNVTVRTIPYGGPSQYADALGIPAKYRREFIEMFRGDNGLDKAGKISPHNPVVRFEYTFKDGTTIKLGDEEAIKDKINKAKSGKKGVTGKIRQKITAAGIACGTFTWNGVTYNPGDRVPQNVIAEIKAQNK